MNMPLSSRTLGVSLVEVAIASALLATVMMLTSAALRACFFAAESTTLEAGLESSAAAAMDTVVSELKDAGTKYSNFSIGSDQRSITFARCIGYAANAPVFGNQISYAVVSYGSALCLERTEMVNGAAQKRILTDQLYPSALTMPTPQGVNVIVTGANFQMLSAGVVTMSLAVARSNYILNQNTTAVDDRMVVTSQASTLMINNN